MVSRNRSLPESLASRPGALERTSLGARETLKFHLRAGRAIRCASGSVWITVDGRSDDIILSAGEIFLTGNAKSIVVIEGLERSAIEMFAP